MKKRYLILSIILFLFVAAGLIVFLRVRSAYVRAGVTLVETREGTYSWNGKFFLSEDGSAALFYRPTERIKLEKVTRTDVDLTPYGFPGKTFSYFLYNGYALCPDAGYEGLWPVSTPARFLYRDGDAVWTVDTEQRRAWHVFADSEAAVPEDGKGLLAFSSDGSFALSLTGGVASVYETDPESDSLRISTVKTVDLNKLGKNAAFVAFTGTKYAAFTVTADGEKRFAALDCAAGEAVLSPADSSLAYGETLSRFYAQRPLTEEEGAYCAAWTNLLLGTDVRCKGEEDSLVLTAVSPGGTHAAARQGDKLYLLTAKRLFCLSDRLNGETVLAVDFPEEKAVALTVSTERGPAVYCYTILF